MNLLFRMAIGGCCEALTRILGSCAEPTSRGFNSSSCTDPDGLVGGVWFGVVNARGCLVGWVGVEIVLSSWEGFFVFHVNAVLSAYRLGVWGQCVVTSFPSLAGSSRSTSGNWVMFLTVVVGGSLVVSKVTGIAGWLREGRVTGAATS